jgi:hypothetical protein
MKDSKTYFFEIKTAVVPKKNEVFQRTLYIQQKNDVFEQSSLDKLEALTQRARNDPNLTAMKATSFKEGISFGLAKNQAASNKDKLLVNKEKNIRRKFEKEHEEAEKKDVTLIDPNQASRVRVKIPNIMFYEPDENESPEYITKYLDNQKNQLTSILVGMINVLKNNFQMEGIKTNVRNCVKLDLSGKRLMDYVIIFFDKESLANEFVDLVDGTEFNRCILKPEILPNRPNF